MANTITRTIKEKTARRAVVVASIVSDGTPAEATDAVLVDRSDFLGPDGTEPGRLVIERIEYSCEPFQVTLEFEHTTDDLIAVLLGNGVLDFAQGDEYQGFIDPASAGGTGDVVGTTLGIGANEGASFVFYLRFKD